MKRNASGMQAQSDWAWGFGGIGGRGAWAFSISVQTDELIRIEDTLQRLCVLLFGFSFPSTIPQPLLRIMYKYTKEFVYSASHLTDNDGYIYDFFRFCFYWMNLTN